MIVAAEQGFVDHSFFHGRFPEQQITNLRPDHMPDVLSQQIPHRQLADQLAACHESWRQASGDSRRLTTEYLFLAFNYCRLRLATIVASRDATHWRTRVRLIQGFLVESHWGLAHRVARAFASERWPLELLVGESSLPMLRAIDRFDVSRGFHFSTYATHAIRNHLLRFLHREQRQALPTYGSIPTEQPANHSSTAGTWSESDSHALPDPSLLKLLDAGLMELDERSRRILVERFGLRPGTKARSYQEIARLFGISKERVRQLALRSLDRLRSSLGGPDGVASEHSELAE